MEPKPRTSRVLGAAAPFAVVALAAIKASAMREPLQDAKEMQVFGATRAGEDQARRRTLLPSTHQLDEVIGQRNRSFFLVFRTKS